MARPTIVNGSVLSTSFPTTTANFTPGAGSDYLFGFTGNDTTLPTAQWRASNMAKIASEETGAELSFGTVVGLWGIGSPGTTSGALTGMNALGAALALSGINSTTPYSGGGVHSAAATTSFSFSRSPNADQRVVFVAICDAGGSSFTATASGDTTIHGQESGADWFGVIVGSSVGNVSFTLSASHPVLLLYAYAEGATASNETLTVDAQPTTGTVGVPLDSFLVGSSDLASTETVTVTKASGPGTLSGTPTVALAVGEATFLDLAFDAPGDYTLSFTAPGHDAVISGVVTVSDPAPAAQPALGRFRLTMPR